MTGAIYLRQGKQLVEMIEHTYDSESLLQELLATHAKLLAGDQMNSTSPRRWLLVGREVSILSEAGDQFSLDHLFLDQDAVPTLVEVKRSTDHRIRREIVGQMLDYAANAAIYWPISALRSRYEMTCQQQGVEGDDQIIELLNAEIDGEEVVESFWQQVEDNLATGRLRLLFVADEIPPQLRRIVEFLNEHMDRIEVLAIEVKQYVGQDHTALVPRLLGQTITAQQKKSTTQAKGQWDESSFFEDMTQTHGEEYAKIAQQIVEWARPQVDHFYWGEGKLHAACVPTLYQNGIKHQLFAIRAQSGTVQIYFKWYAKKPPFDNEAKRLELLQQLNLIPGVQIPSNAINRQPSIALSSLADSSALTQFLQAYDWFIEQVRSG